MQASPPRWVRPCLLGMLVALGVLFTWGIAGAQIRPPRPIVPRPPGMGGPNFPQPKVLMQVYTCLRCGRELARGPIGTVQRPTSCPFCSAGANKGIKPPRTQPVQPPVVQQPPPVVQQPAPVVQPPPVQQPVVAQPPPANPEPAPPVALPEPAAAPPTEETPTVRASSGPGAGIIILLSLMALTGLGMVGTGVLMLTTRNR